MISAFTSRSPGERAMLSSSSNGRFTGTITENGAYRV